MSVDYYLFFIFGTIVGSFTNVLIYRLPRGEGFVTGRSKCPHCHEILKWYDLIPLFSFIFLAGKCRNCGKKISWSYFFVELVSGLIFMLSFLYFFASPLQMITTIILLETLLILFVTDIKYFVLPDSVILVGAAAAIINGISLERVLTALLFFLLFASIWFLSKGKWLGLGDGKLMVLVGLAFGAVGSITVLYAAMALGTIIGIFLLIFKRAGLKTKLPLGSFICFFSAVYIFYVNFLGYDIIKQLRSMQLILNIFK